jgi:hypothetical protein
MSTTDHSCDASGILADAALWLASTPKELRPKSAVVEIRQRFPLDTRGAIEAIRLADRLRRTGGGA